MTYTPIDWTNLVPPPINATNLDRIEKGIDDVHNQTTLIQATGRRLQESGGPTTLTVGAIADDEYVKRSGATLVGGTPAGGGGFSSKARAYLSSNQENLSSAAYTKVLLNAETYDVDGEFDSVTNHRFIATSAGYYLTIGNVTYLGASVVADKRYAAVLYKDGAGAAYAYVHASYVRAISAHISDVFYLDVDGFIELYAFHEAGVDTVDVYSGSMRTYLAIHRLS